MLSRRGFLRGVVAGFALGMARPFDGFEAVAKYAPKPRCDAFMAVIDAEYAALKSDWIRYMDHMVMFGTPPPVEQHGLLPASDNPD